MNDNPPPTITVIITTNDRPTDILKRSIRSVMNQSYPKIELIVVDSSINNNSQVVLSSIDGVRYITCSHNLNGSSARNIGIDNSHGEYIAFLDDDDEWLPEKITKQYALMKPNVGIVCSDYTTDDGTVIHSRNDANADSLILSRNYIGPTSVPLLSRKCLDNCGYFDAGFESNQEWDLWIRIAKKYDVAYYPEPLAIKHESADSISNDTKKRISGWFTILIKHSGDYLKHPEQLSRALMCFSAEMRSKKKYALGSTLFILSHIISLFCKKNNDV